MTDAQPMPQEVGKPTRSRGLILPLILLVSAGTVGFYGTYSGLIPWGSSQPVAASGSQGDGHGDDGHGESLSPGSEYGHGFDFVPVDPLVVTVSESGQLRHLRFRAQLEVSAGRKSDVEHLMPRVVDVLNGYLRALTLADLEDQAALIRLRGQMLRRIQIVAGPGAVNDLLIMEFVLN